ncbi:MAG TPA: thiamine pyrophosphate-dependent enzyme [Flexilinea sp.]|jgi:2-oxoglutarate ferredoxin oxidoreductase subunit beta|nr:thiamine pyrophosphate-dependent enzyme [Flexilinea sp.]HPG20244.1 thiamine pyrophosphate-dependent enzyme [Flexilinea sp.]HPJ65377.1 thiamine pyrophosphate-dependent enzyme [Flexilinea sp.]HPR71449.1 thiamine pyrophosphate-dependent enzyme [Flexilinea sp.]
MKPVYEPTIGMLPVDTSYCPGCGHGIAHKLIMECITEKGRLGDTIGVSPIGCSVVAHEFMNIEMCESAHGRASAVATGIKRVHPNHLVFSYQGDGDMASIGVTEIVHAAIRGEKITTFFINNAIFGMTGGQMAPTTLIGQKATTCIDGRKKEVNGMPIQMSEMLATIEGAVYIERVALNTPGNVRKAKKAVMKALEVQEKGLGFSLVEFISSCPTNWGLSPIDALKWVGDNMIPYYPLGVFRSPEGM